MAMPVPPLPLLKPGVPVFLLGPTAIGKSALAMEWAHQIRERKPVILCMDSMQIYRRADIGTGKPTREERAAYPHGGLDLVDVGEPYDVVRYIGHAGDFLKAHADRPVLIVGGTGLYFRSLTQGLCDIPPTPPELREELNAVPAEARLARLRELDPAICGQLDLGNPRRVQRALEVILNTGTSLLDWQRKGNLRPVVSDFRAYFLQRDREALHARIANRVAAMFEAGWMEETAGLIDRHGQEALENFAAIGYGGIARALGGVGNQPGRIPPEERAQLVEKVTQMTRQYARRQLTWFRGEPKLTGLELE